MSKEMQKRMKEKGFIEVRVWVEKRDEGFIKFLAKFCREGREKKEKERFEQQRWGKSKAKKLQ